MTKRARKGKLVWCVVCAFSCVNNKGSNTEESRGGEPREGLCNWVKGYHVGLARTIYLRCICGIFGREIPGNPQIYGVYERF